MWNSNVLCTVFILLTVFVSASVCSTNTPCPYPVLQGNCSTSSNCTDRTRVYYLNHDHNITCTENATNHTCSYTTYRPNVELGVKVPVPTEIKYFRIPDKNFDASTNKEDASRARINNKAIGPYKAAWCPESNDSAPWIDVKFDTPVVIEKIEMKGYDGKWIKNFTLQYLNSTGQFVSYNNMVVLTSGPTGSCHYVFINQTKKLRINSVTPGNEPCLQLAIYGQQSNDVLPSPVVTVTVIPTNKYKYLNSASLANEDFLKGYLLWIIFIALLVFLVLFTLAFLFCWCCRRDYPLKSAMEKSKEANPDYVPAWRRVDAKAEKGYIASQETQEVKIVFTDEYIPPGLQKEKQDPNDEKFYRHRIFSFSGCQPANSYMAREQPKATQENGTTGK